MPLRYPDSCGANDWIQVDGNGDSYFINGHVGIGTTSPGIGPTASRNILTIGGSDNGVVELANDKTSNNYLNGELSYLAVNNTAANDEKIANIKCVIENATPTDDDHIGGALTFLTKPKSGPIAEAMRISGNGNVIIKGGGWDTGHLIIGNHHIWVGDGGILRHCEGPPSGPNDDHSF